MLVKCPDPFTFSDNAVESYTYDANGNLKTVSLANGDNSSYQYDDLNRQYIQNHVSGADTTNVTFTLDGNGNIEQATETFNGSASSINANFDNLDRITQISNHDGNVIQFTYDANGNRKILNDPKNSQSTYIYDDLNRLAQAVAVGTGSFDYVYNSAGLLKEVSNNTNGKSQYTYDNANRIDTIINLQSGVPTATLDYDYDANGNRVKLTQSNINNNEVITYSFDNADRMTQVTYPDVTVSYGLDKVGNRVSESADDGNSTITKTYTHNNRDQITNITDTNGLNVTYTYDDTGNRIQSDKNGEITTFDYTPRQRIKSITKAGNTTSFKYDYLGNRIEKTSGGQTRKYTFDGTSLLYETNVLGNVLAKYHYGSDRVLAETRNGVNSYIYHDALRTPVAVTNQDGSIQNRLDYDAWGNLREESGTSEHPFGFTGYQWDEETNLYYAMARYYDPEEGRFLREDPLQGEVNTPPSLHRYNYAYNNPTVYIDPDGQLGIFIDGTWNNKFDPDEERYGTHTNVKKLYDLYEGEEGLNKIYTRGVGTGGLINSVVCGITGCGTQFRVTNMYNKVVKIINNNKHLKDSDPEAWNELITLDFFGFSRGSSAAIALTNKIAREGIPDFSSARTRTKYYRGHPVESTYYDDNIEGVNMRFLGVFDTVEAQGYPLDGDHSKQLVVNREKVAQTSHAIMMHENRFGFDSTALDDLENPQFSNITQRIFPGAHSNGGGGYGLVDKLYWYFRFEQYRLAGNYGLSIPYPQLSRETMRTKDQGKTNGIANLTLLWMYNQGAQAGAPFKPISSMAGIVPDLENMTMEEIEKEFVHNSKQDWMYSIERWLNRTNRTVYYPFKSRSESEKTFSYEELRNLYNLNRELIIRESSSKSGVKAK